MLASEFFLSSSQDFLFMYIGIRIPAAKKKLSSISKWCREFSEECQEKALSNPDTPNEMELMKENLRLRKKLEEAKKENLFLKKAAAFFAMEID